MLKLWFVNRTVSAAGPLLPRGAFYNAGRVEPCRRLTIHGRMQGCHKYFVAVRILSKLTLGLSARHSKVVGGPQRVIVAPDVKTKYS